MRVIANCTEHVHDMPRLGCLASAIWLRHACGLQAGMRILQQGGNAADAAVAVAAALNVTEPCSTGESEAVPRILAYGGQTMHSSS
jgi:Gamma-glutamyltranspeptidase